MPQSVLWFLYIFLTIQEKNLQITYFERSVGANQSPQINPRNSRLFQSSVSQNKQLLLFLSYYLLIQLKLFRGILTYVWTMYEKPNMYCWFHLTKSKPPADGYIPVHQLTD